MKRPVRKSLCAAAALLVAAGLLLALPSSALAYDGSVYTWEWQNPFPTDRQVTSVSAASATISWGVGGYGQIYLYNGGTLTRQTSPTTNNLYGVDALPGATTTAWAVGQAGTIIYTTNSGTTWTAQTSGTTYDLMGVAVITATNVYAVGGYDGITNPIILHYNGTAWSPMTIPPAAGDGGLTDIVAIDATHIWAVGQTPAAGLDRGQTLFCDGSTWVQTNTNYAMISVDAYFTSPNYYVWGVTWGGDVIRSTDGGVSYTVMFTDSWPASVTAVNSTNVWVVGWSGTIKFWNNVTWATQTSNTTTDVYDVDAFSATGQFSVGYSNFLSNTGTATWTVRTGTVAAFPRNNCVSYGTDEVWAVGAGASATGNIVHSSDGGATWVIQTSGVSVVLQSIDAADANTLYAAGLQRKPLKTTNGGTTWAAVSANPTNTQWYGVAVADASIVWIAGASGYVNKTTNGGTGWSAQTSNAGANTIRSIDCVDVNNAMLVADAYKISTTTNGGGTWTARTPPGTAVNLQAVSMASASVAWAVGASGRILYTTDGGVNWTAETSPTTDQINGVAEIDTTHAWAVTATGKILYRDGSTWSVHSTPTTSPLNAVYAWDASNAWAVGGPTSPANAYILFADPPYIKSVAPNHGEPDETVDVEVVGGYTHFSDTTPTLDFGAGVSMVPGSLNVVDNTTLFAQVYVDPGAAPGPRDVEVTTGDETPVPLAGGFYVGSGPAVTSASPAKKPRGWTGDVDVAGSQTGFSDSSHAGFGTGVAVNSTTYVNSQRVIANVTVSPSASPGSRDVNVTTGTENPTPLAEGFTVATPPNVASLSPSNGSPGSEVTVTGTGFGADQYQGGGARASSVSFNGVPSGPVTEWSDTLVKCTVPEGAATGPVTVTTPDGTSNANKIFSINHAQTAPSISSISPGSGPTGTEVTVRGASFGPSQGQSHVTFGEKMAVCSSWSDREIRCTVPSGAIASAAPGVVQVKVTTAAGTSNPVSFTVTAGPGADSTWYLAEGSTAWGFQTYITIENPNDEACTASIKYNTDSGAGMAPEVALPARSQTTVNPASVVPDQDFSTQVTCLQGKTIAVDRTMFWTGPGAPSPEAHSSIGVTSPSKTWYLPEGSSAWNFETWTLVENPNAQDAHVSLTYMVEGATGPKVLTRTVPAYSRASFDMASDLGMHADASIKVTADQPVIAEGSTYRNNRREGSCSVGATAPAADYFLSEGSTAWGFTTYVLVQNPNSEPATVTLTYMTPQGPKAQPPFTMSANSRKTIRVNDALTNTDFSTQVQSTKPIIASRSMYWGAGTALGEACHSSIGLPQAHMNFYLPDGQTSDGYETYTLIQNPNPVVVKIRVTYLPQGGGASITFTDEIPAGSRRTYAMSDKIESGRASVMVQSLDGARPIMVERSMYWNSRGAGTDTVSGNSD